MSTQQQREMTVSSIQQEWRVHPNNCIICETCVSIVIDVPRLPETKTLLFSPPSGSSVNWLFCLSPTAFPCHGFESARNVEDWQSKTLVTPYFLPFYFLRFFFCKRNKETTVDFVVGNCWMIMFKPLKLSTRRTCLPTETVD